VTKRSLLLVLLAAIVICAAVSPNDKKPAPDPRVPMRLEEIHYYLTNPASAILFLESHFEAREVVQPGAPRLRYVTMLALEPDEGVFELSPPGPFDGIVDADPKQWSKEMVPPAVNLPARYGVYWVGIRTTSLKKAMQKIEGRGVTVQEHRLILPIDPRAKAASIYGPDLNVFALVERSRRHNDTGEFGLDHIQLLVKNVAENVRFFEDVFAAQVQGHSEHQAFLTVAGFPLALSDPEGLDLVRADVQERSPSQFRFEADHISFLYSDIHPAVVAAKAKGRNFTQQPTRLEYFGKPTAHTYAVINSPDGLAFELLMHDK